MDWNSIPESVRTRVEEWLSYEYDSRTREDVQWLMEHNVPALLDAFGCDLEFGTGGLRGIMGVGPNRINIYTVRRTTVGLGHYLREVYGTTQEVRVAIAYDSRNESIRFAEETASVLADMGFRVYLYASVRPTPQLSFTVRNLRCHAGVVITASHNPKEYNGYKVYWRDGGQVTPPHDGRIMEAIRQATGTHSTRKAVEGGCIIRLDAEFDEPYVSALLSSMHHPECVAAQREMGIVYTPIHGAGGGIVPGLLRRMGFNHVHLVTSQRDTDGNFPTVSSPNPEESAAMALAMEMGEAQGADLVLGTDPDGDRVGAYARNASGELVRLNGNQLAVLLAYYQMEWLKEQQGVVDPYLVRTIVTSPMLDALAASYGVRCEQVLTGFKYIAERIAAQEGHAFFLFGGEESHGYLVGTDTRDKDAMQACALLAEMTAWAKCQGTTLVGLLEKLYAQYGYWYEMQHSLVRQGEAGRNEIAMRMQRLRDVPPTALAGEEITQILDYQLGQCSNLATGDVESIHLPKSNVLQLVTNQGSVLTVRPSGTEPKIKYYASVRGSYEGFAQSEAAQRLRAEMLVESLIAL